MNLEGYRLTTHAAKALMAEGILWEEAERVLSAPERTYPARLGTTMHEIESKLPDGRWRLVRAVIDFNNDPPTVITMYTTRKAAEPRRRR
jgi:hypothetical protein